MCAGCAAGLYAMRFRSHGRHQPIFVLGARERRVAQMQFCMHLRPMAPKRIPQRNHVLGRDYEYGALIQMRVSIELIELGESSELSDMPL